MSYQDDNILMSIYYSHLYAMTRSQVSLLTSRIYEVSISMMKIVNF